MSSLFSQSSVNVADLPDQAFESLIKNFLTDILTKRSGMRPESISKYLDNKDNMKQLMSAFTHWSFDPINNYEYYETLGDVTLNKCVVWYFHKRFPTIRTSENPSRIMTALKTKNISKFVFSKLSDFLKLENYIRYRPILDKKKKKPVMIDNKMKTDVFESLFGTLEDIINNTEQMMGIGEVPVYNIVSTLIDQVKNISLDIEDLVDDKSKISEIFSKYRETSEHQYIYKEVGKPNPANPELVDKFYQVSLKLKFKNPYNPSETITYETPVKESRKKLEAEKMVAKDALAFMKNYGITFS
jgi:dsRNA-specific ribonuclease